MNWAILCGEFGRPGGVSDYTTAVAEALACSGDEVTVYASAPSLAQLSDRRFRVVELPGRFGPPAHRSLDLYFKARVPDRVLVQYVPQAFGWHGMNLLFALWLHARRKRYPIWMMYHEVAVPFRRTPPLRHNLHALVTKIMARLTARAASRIFIGALAWERTLRPMIPRDKPIMWTPVPSNVPVREDHAGANLLRRRYLAGPRYLIGHFGTYGPLVAEPLMVVLATLMEQRPECAALMLGAYSSEFVARLSAERPELAERIFATDALPGSEVSRHIQACDLMIQPYPDGLSTRRGSAMVGLAHGIPILSTSGPSTESIWREYRAAHLTPAHSPGQLGRHASRLLDEPEELKRLGAAGKSLYDERFALPHTITALREQSAETEAV